MRLSLVALTAALLLIVAAAAVVPLADAVAAPTAVASAKKKAACKTKRTSKRTTTTCVTTKRTCTRKTCTTIRRTCTTVRRKGSKKAKRTCRRKVTRRPRPGVPGTPKPPAASQIDLTPRDYTKIAGLSQPTFTDIERTVVPFTTKDGVDLHIEVIKPKGATNLGVILEASPYHGTLYERTGTRILPLPLDKDGNPVGLTGYFPQRGYAVVMMDLRGTGKSGGCLNHLGAEDQADLKEIIEWAATQPWSNGRVGMTGHSYVGSTPMIATKLSPKGLVTIVPSAGLAKMYDHQFQGGVPFYLQLAGPIHGYQSLAVDSALPPIGTDPVSGAPTGDDFGNHPEKAVCGLPDNALVAAGPSQYFGQEVDFHRERDATKEATAFKGHVFLVHGVNDEAARISAMDWFTQRGNRAGDKLWIGQWDHGIGCCPNQRGIQWTEALHAWFDRQLLERPVDTGPPVEAYLNDEALATEAVAARKQIHTQAGWPGAPTKVSFGTGAAGTLVENSAGEPGTVAFAGTPQGFLDPTTAPAAQFETPAFAADTMVVGVPELDLAVSVTSPRVDLIATLYAKRDNDLRRVTQWSINPLLRDGLATISPTIPAARMDLKPPAFPMAHTVRKGTSLVLRITTSDPDKVPWAAIDPNVSVFAGPGATTLRLPVVTPNAFADTVSLGAPPNGAGVGG